MINNLCRYLIGFIVFTLSFCVLAGDSDTRSYELPDNGNMQLVVHKSWRDQMRQPPNKLPPTIVFTPRNGNSFQVLMTPMWAFREGITMPNLSEIKKNVQQSAKEVSAQAVENSIPIRKVKGKQGGGHYFTVTDRAPKPGEYKYMTQGMIRIGELAATFTILSNDEAKNVVANAIKMLSTAIHVK